MQRAINAEDMDVDEENMQAGTHVACQQRIQVSFTWHEVVGCANLFLCMQADESDGLEMEANMQEDMAEDMFFHDETEGSDEELGAHRAIAVAGSCEEGRAQLDNLDSMDAFAGDMSEQEVGMEEDHGSMKEATEESSDEEAAIAAIPARRRLRGKQTAPEYGSPPSDQVQGQPGPAAAMPRQGLPVIKRLSMLKRPAGRAPFLNECCRGFEEAACRFCSAEPGKPARVQPARGVRHCVFCNKERMEAAHGVVRRNVLTAAVKKFLAVDKGIFQVALQRIQLFMGEQVAKQYEKKAGGAPQPEHGWEEALTQRKAVSRPLTRKQKEEFDAAVRRDQRVARRKLFFPEKLMARASKEVENQEKTTMEEFCGPTCRVQVRRREECWRTIASLAPGACARNVRVCAPGLSVPWTFAGSTNPKCRPTNAQHANMGNMCLSQKMSLSHYEI